MAAIGLLGGFDVVYIPGGLQRRVEGACTRSGRDLFPWGSHPLLDPLWSTEATRFIHHGAETARVEKAGVVARSEVAMRRLRVCWENRDSAYNCGVCEKCLRTMINLQAHGRLTECETLPSELDYARVARMPLVSPNIRAFARENLEAAEHFDPRLARALGLALRRPHLRSRGKLAARKTALRVRNRYRRQAGAVDF